MANKALFRTYPGSLPPKADAINHAGGTAYRMESRHALAQYAATGCLNSTFYASAEDQLTEILELVSRVDAEFIAKTAVFARTQGFMKDLPALLCAVLSIRDPELMNVIFHRVIDSTRMLRNFAQIIRSGKIGRKSLGTRPKRLIKQWLENRSLDQLFEESVGQAPSLADIIKMTHPRPDGRAREALYGYLIGRERSLDELPPCVREFELYKTLKIREGIQPPDVPFQFLTSLELGREEWKAIARRAPWQMTRMNLNTFLRHEVFDEKAMVGLIAARLRNRKAIRSAKVFPYQLMTAYASAAPGMPPAILDALQDALEIALENVPRLSGRVLVFLDVSGSMHSPVTGHRRGATTVVRCVDAAALIAAALARTNRNTRVVPFSDDVVDVRLNRRDSVMTSARVLASLPPGGTNCSAPLRSMNRQHEKADLVAYISDNQSWVDSKAPYLCFGATETMIEWAKFKKRNPQAKMVCIDIQPYATVQAAEQRDIVHVAGFSDSVFSLISAVANGRIEPGYWVKRIEAVELREQPALSLPSGRRSCELS